MQALEKIMYEDGWLRMQGRHSEMVMNPSTFVYSGELRE